MSKVMKTALGIIIGVVGVLLLAYVVLCCMSAKPGMNGFTVTNGMIRLLVSGEDYIELGEDRYLYKAGSLGLIIENEYDSYLFTNEGYRYEKMVGQELTIEYFYRENYESGLLKLSLVTKNDKVLKGSGVNVWSWLVNDVNSLYYSPL